jgi:AraC-like DNA-binding protein
MAAMNPETVETFLRVATFALAAAAAVAVLLRRPGSAAAGALSFVIGGIAAFVVASAHGSLAGLGLAAFAFDAWCLATPAVVWLLALLLFREDFRVRPAHLAIVGLFAVAAFAANWGRSALGPLGGYPEFSRGLLLACRGAAILLLAAACTVAAMSWKADLVEERRRLRPGFVAVFSLVFIALAGSEFVFGGRGAPVEARIAGLASLLVLAFTALQLIARGGLDEALATAAPRETPPLALVTPGVVRAVAPGPGAEAALARRVVEEMQGRRLWKREGLGIAALAAELRTQEYLLRRAINRHLGYRNFNEFLHDYRLKEAAQRLASPAERHLPVLSIALDCGYASIGPFNRAFKARFGVTPTQYRALRGNELLADSEESVRHSGAALFPKD